MIRYNLKCAEGHEFDAWFASAAAYGKQAENGAIECPLCGDRNVEKALMAPNLSRSGANAKVESETPDDQRKTVGMVSGAGGEAEKALGKLREFVEGACEDVGDKFPEEARKIHYGEAEARGIYGEATQRESEELVEEGIPVGRLPWRSRRDA